MAANKSANIIMVALLLTVAAHAPARAQTGPRILYESGTVEGSGLFIMDADGSNQTELDVRTGVGRAPVWSRDGCRIVFWHEIRKAGERSVRTGIYVMHADGSNQNPLVGDVDAGMEQDLRSRFSPDGSKIVFISTEQGHSDVTVVNSDGSGVRKLTEGKGFYAFNPSWSPDGRKILFGSNGRPPRIQVMNSNGTDLQDIGGGTHARWSPDGSRIAFVSSEKGRGDIAVMNSDGTNVKVLTSGTGFSLRPSWSPDGSRIAFQRVGDNDIFLEVMNADGTNRTTLADHLLFDLSERAEEPSWSPDGSRIAFTRMPSAVSEMVKSGMGGLGFDIYIVSIDGSNLKRLTTAGAAGNPTWSPTAKCHGNP